jgi:hypothetical protein
MYTQQLGVLSRMYVCRSARQGKGKTEACMAGQQAASSRPAGSWQACVELFPDGVYMVVM